MSSKEQYVTITHYREREFYFLNYAIQTKDGIIPREIEQFHESDKVKFIEKIRELQSQYTNNNIVSISLLAKQFVTQDDDKNRVTARIFNDNFVDDFYSYLLQASNKIISKFNKIQWLYTSPFATALTSFRFSFIAFLT